jgi:hypothetical protein
MAAIKRKRCLHCKSLFRPDPRNADRQRYCCKPDCRKASKAASQKRWLQKPENQKYFHGPEHVKRVQQWRQAHPGYWRPKPSVESDALQDLSTEKIVENSRGLANFALQDLLAAQPYVLIGLIANFTGTALQDAIASTMGRLQQLGHDIINANPGGEHGRQTSHLPGAHPAGPQTIQLVGPAPGA